MSLAIGIFLIFLPFAFAGGLVYFMASGKGVKPLEEEENETPEKSEKNGRKSEEEQ